MIGADGYDRPVELNLSGASTAIHTRGPISNRHIERYTAGRCKSVANCRALLCGRLGDSEQQADLGVFDVVNEVPVGATALVVMTRAEGLYRDVRFRRAALQARDERATWRRQIKAEWHSRLKEIANFGLLLRCAIHKGREEYQRNRMVAFRTNVRTIYRARR